MNTDGFDFKRSKDVERFAYRLLKENGLTAWRVGFNHNVRFGVCKHDEKAIFISLVGMQYSTPEAIRDTVIHEVAHAVVGPGNGHNAKWVRAAKKLGLENPQRLASEKTGSDVQRKREETAKWRGRCKCERVFYRHRLTKNVRRTGRCTVCKEKIRWVANN